jgi:hypothetical protein
MVSASVAMNVPNEASHKRREEWPRRLRAASTHSQSLHVNDPRPYTTRPDLRSHSASACAAAEYRAVGPPCCLIRHGTGRDRVRTPVACLHCA